MKPMIETDCFSEVATIVTVYVPCLSPIRSTGDTSKACNGWVAIDFDKQSFHFTAEVTNWGKTKTYKIKIRKLPSQIQSLDWKVLPGKVEITLLKKAQIAEDGSVFYPDWKDYTGCGLDQDCTDDDDDEDLSETAAFDPQSNCGNTVLTGLPWQQAFNSLTQQRINNTTVGGLRYLVQCSVAGFRAAMQALETVDVARLNELEKQIPGIMKTCLEAKKRNYIGYTLPPRTGNESLHDYVKRLVINAVGTTDALARVFSYLIENCGLLYHTEEYKHFIVGTVVEVIKSNKPGCFAILYEDKTYNLLDQP